MVTINYSVDIEFDHAIRKYVEEHYKNVTTVSAFAYKYGMRVYVYTEENQIGEELWFDYSTYEIK